MAKEIANKNNQEMIISNSKKGAIFKFVKYSFDPSTIVEMRQTYVEHEGEWLDGDKSQR